MSGLKFAWMLVVPIIYPIVSLPMILTHPLQLILALITTGLLAIDLRIAIAFVVLAVVYYSWTVFVPPRDYRGYAQWAANRPSSFTGKLSQVVLTGGLLGGLLWGMQEFTSLSPVLRWFASFGLAYFFSAVAAGYLNVPNMIAQDRAL